jgi:hypothetical protein
MVWLAPASACRHHAAPPSGHTVTPPPDVPAPVTQIAPVDPTPESAGSLAFPLQPHGCPYALPAVMPGHPRLVPHTDISGPDAAPRNMHITFVGDPSTTAVIQWSTGIRTLTSQVRFGPAGAPMDQIADGYSFTYGGAGQRREHEVHVCGLEPGRRYHYEAGGSGGWLGPFEFVTAPAGVADVRIAVVGDSRTDPVTWGHVASQIQAERVEAMLFTGDAVVDGANQSRWDEFFAAGQGLLASTPSLWVDGNHEGIASVYFAQFAFPDNGSPNRREHWYALPYGPLEVIALNDTTLPNAEIVGEERDFLERTLASLDRARTPWVATFHHQPLYTTSIGHLPDVRTRAAWGPLFERYHVNFDLAGHVHNYESSEPMRGGEVTDDAHGTRFFTFGGAGAPLYRFHAPQPWVHGTESTHGYAVMNISATHVTWIAHRLDGSVIETVEIPATH